MFLNIGIAKRNKLELESLFRLVGFIPIDMWNDPAPPMSKLKIGLPIFDKAQLVDPLYNLYSEVEHPDRFKEYISSWRSGAEIRFKMPYYPQTLNAKKTFSYI